MHFTRRRVLLDRGQAADDGVVLRLIRRRRVLAEETGPIELRALTNWGPARRRLEFSDHSCRFKHVCRLPQQVVPTWQLPHLHL